MKIVPIFILLYLSCFLGAQTPLQVDTSHHCQYTGQRFEEELYTFEADPALLNLVEEIRIKGNAPFPIKTYYANVSNVAALVVDTSYWLLVGYNFFHKPANTLQLYALLAHEIGHIAQRHQLDESSRIREESAADEFMGFALMQTKQTESLEFLINNLVNIPFSYDWVLPWTERAICIRRGWNRAFGLINGLGFGNDPLEIEKLPLPRFDQISCLPSTPPLSTTKLNKCKTLGQVDNLLTGVLDQLGYAHRSYYAVSGGYVLTTHIEQFYPDGTSVKGPQRWQDAPKKERITDLFAYLSSITFKRADVRLRLFAFIVSKQPTLEVYRPGCVSPEQIPDWLRGGGAWLPGNVENLSFLPDFKVRAMVFEFFIPDTTKKFMHQCSKPLSVATHLEKSGIMMHLR